MTDRDHRLGAALRELEVPEHAPGFEAGLGRRLAAERGRRRLVWGAPAVAVAAAAAALAIFFVGLPGEERVPELARPQVATAAEIKTTVRAALARAQTLSGVVVADERGDERRWRFAMTAAGDFRLTGIDLVSDTAYDASRGVTRSLNPSASLGGEGLFAAERRGIAPGPPDGGPPAWLLQRELGAFVRALLAADDPRVQETRYRGRPAWELDVEAVPNAIVPDLSGDRFSITIDRATGIPVRVVESKEGAVLRELRIEGLAVDAELAPATFTIDFPAGMEVMRSDEGFRRVRLSEVASRVGYAPLVPGWVPEGFELAEVAVAPVAMPPTGPEGGNPPSEQVVSLSYRRGLDQLVVTTRAAGGDPGRWSDPFAGEGFVDPVERIRIGSGALAGREAELVIAPRAIPHLWALDDGLVVTVAGDAGRAELIRVAGSLSP